jgi:hypothetical protein
VTIRILADREPYSDYADEPSSDGASEPSRFVTGPSGPFVILNGPAGIDDKPPDILVLPAEDFLALRCAGTKELGEGIIFLPYGPVALMEKAFEHGCSDYLREPWSLPELRARGSRLLRLRFTLYGKSYELRGMLLAGEESSALLNEGERALLRLLLLNAPLPVARPAAISSLSLRACEDSHALFRYVASLRRKLNSMEPGLGGGILAIRGFGYRLDSASCG